MKKLLFLLTLGIQIISYAQINPSPKTVEALKIVNSPTIDGVLDEDFWNNAQTAKDFIQFRPASGDKEPAEKKTEVKIAYDNEAIYFGAYLYENDMKNIPMEFATRDNFGQVDWFGIMINPNDDGQNDTEFFIQITGNQADAKATKFNEDFSWSDVWKSAVKLEDDKWVVEVKIPYAALRFSNEEVQTWGLNFHRRFQNSKEQYTWNPIDKTKGNIQQYAGKLTGINNIKPPVRLSFFPYASASYSTFDGVNQFNKSYGMDLKYGLNESFTLDLTLIPDFGQTAFDNITLNLGPFEQHFDEKRAFFTEGTDLFSIGKLFYSRRVGDKPSAPIDEDDLAENESFVKNSNNVQMLNAVKISGRTKKGLGIGFFNAITEKTTAVIKNNDTEEIRKVVTEPFTNYNVLVLDQQFNQNSSVSFVNTSVLREGYYRDANVNALLFNLTNKANKYNIEGGGGMSYINNIDESTTGFFTDLEIRKVSGNWQYGVENHIQNNTFNKNDMGFQRRNNFSNFEAYFSYRTFEPTEKFDNYRITLWSELEYLYEPNTYTGNDIGLNYNFQFKESQFAFGGNLQTSIGEQFDYYEPRVEGRYFRKTGRYAANQWFSTDYRKKFALDFNVFYSKRIDDDNYYLNSEISPRYRVNDKLSLVYELEYTEDTNDKGFVSVLDDDTIIFGKRDTKAITNALSSKFNFSTKSALSLTFRHYWSPVQYESLFYDLNEKGNLVSNKYSENHDINFNAWNLDLNYSWEFAPGSQLVALYRNAIFNEDELSHVNFNTNLENLFKEPVLTNFSLKFIYYLDYNNLKTLL